MLSTVQDIFSRSHHNFDTTLDLTPQQAIEIAPKMLEDENIDL
jgi:hypothetical protein